MTVFLIILTMYEYEWKLISEIKRKIAIKTNSEIAIKAYIWL